MGFTKSAIHKVNWQKVGFIAGQLTLATGLIGCSTMMSFKNIISESELGPNTNKTIVENFKGAQEEELRNTKEIPEENNYIVTPEIEAVASKSEPDATPEVPTVDLSFTLEEVGYPYSTEKIVPFQDNGKTINFLYSLTSPEWNWRSLGRWKGTAITEKYKGFVEKMLDSSWQEPDYYIYEWLETLDDDTAKWLDRYIFYGNSRKFRNEDGTLEWKLIYTSQDGETCLFSLWGDITVVNRGTYKFYPSEEYYKIPSSLWEKIKEGYTYFDISDPENIKYKANIYDFLSEYSME